MAPSPTSPTFPVLRGDERPTRPDPRPLGAVAGRDGRRVPDPLVPFTISGTGPPLPDRRVRAMRIAVTGATGRIGYVAARHLVGRGHDVVTLGRRPTDLAGAAHRDFHLGGPDPDLAGVDAVVHAAFSHLPGRYRGGEGDDPERFLRLNRDGTLRLFAHASASGVRRIVFLSSRAVLDGYPPGPLTEGLPPRPQTLYGTVKAEAEAALAALSRSGLEVASLRATGVYGPSIPGHPHKWTALFAAFGAGEPIAPRIGTELHVEDLVAAADLLLTAPAPALRPLTFHASDILLDRHDLLATYATLTGRPAPLPPRSDPGRVATLETDRLRTMGWTARGEDGLLAALRAMAP